MTFSGRRVAHRASCSDRPAIGSEHLHRLDEPLAVELLKVAVHLRHACIDRAQRQNGLIIHQALERSRKQIRQHRFFLRQCYVSEIAVQG